MPSSGVEVAVMIYSPLRRIHPIMEMDYDVDYRESRHNLSPSRMSCLN